MLEDHEFCDHCPFCRPAIFDPATGKVLPPEHPVMLTINKLWNNETSYAERKAFIDVTLHNSNKPADLKLARAVIRRLQAALTNN